jgi:hypothetical protein
MSESDPLGLDQHSAGAKLDSGKNRLDLVLGSFCRALDEVGWIGTNGANKYTDNGWLEVPNGIERYSSAMLRHYLKMKKGEMYDPDSGQLHYSHMAWNALAVLELTCRSISPSTLKPQDSTSTQETSHSSSQPVTSKETLDTGDSGWTHLPGGWSVLMNNGKPSLITYPDTYSSSTIANSTFEHLVPLVSRSTGNWVSKKLSWLHTLFRRQTDTDSKN